MKNSRGACGGKVLTPAHQGGNRRTLTETLIAVQNLPAGAFLESSGQVVMEAENGQANSGLARDWLTATAQSGYPGASYLQPLPDLDALYPTSAITTSPVVSYPLNLTTPGTSTLWLRGYATTAAGDSVHVGLAGQSLSVTGFGPNTWDWANQRVSQAASSLTATVVITDAGVYTLSLQMREDGVRIDRLLISSAPFQPAEPGSRQPAAVSCIFYQLWNVDVKWPVPGVFGPRN